MEINELKLNELLRKMVGEVISAGGFTRIRRAASTVFNMVLEARP